MHLRLIAMVNWLTRLIFVNPQVQIRAQKLVVLTVIFYGFSQPPQADVKTVTEIRSNCFLHVLKFRIHHHSRLHKSKMSKTLLKQPSSNKKTVHAFCLTNCDSIKSLSFTFNSDQLWAEQNAELRCVLNSIGIN